MNILIVVEPGVNGVFRYVEALCDFLLSRGLRVHLAYSDIRGSDRLPLLVDRIEAAGGKTVNLRVDSRPLPRDLRALFQLWNFARQVRPDVIHSHSSKAGALSRALVPFGINSRQLYQPHAYRGMQPDAGKFVGIFNLAERLLGLTGGTINVSGDEQAFALNRLRIAAQRSFLIPNGVDCSRFRPVDAKRKMELRVRFNLPLNAPLLGTVCRSSWQKDPLTLYKAFALALQKCPGAYLFHIGEGELDGSVEALIDQLGVRGRVVRLPYLQNPAEAYQAVDGFILTSRYEGFSLAALEALATNLPVIISEAPGTGDIIRLPLSHLWKSRPGDAAGFADSISSWYQALQNPRPVNHAVIVQKSYDSQVSFQQVQELYGAQILDAGGPRLRSRPVQEPVASPSTLALFWSRSLLAIGCIGVFAALILTLKASGNVPFTRFTPDWLTRWVNRHGELRNLFAYALLALPFLLRAPTFPKRVRTVLSLSAFATAVECAQLFIPTRWFDLIDIAMSIVGIGMTWAAVEAIRRCRRNYRWPTLRTLNLLAICRRSIATAARSTR